MTAALISPMYSYLVSIKISEYNGPPRVRSTVRPSPQNRSPAYSPTDAPPSRMRIPTPCVPVRICMVIRNLFQPQHLAQHPVSVIPAPRVIASFRGGVHNLGRISRTAGIFAAAADTRPFSEGPWSHRGRLPSIEPCPNRKRPQHPAHAPYACTAHWVIL